MRWFAVVATLFSVLLLIFASPFSRPIGTLRLAYGGPVSCVSPPDLKHKKLMLRLDRAISRILAQSLSNTQAVDRVKHLIQSFQNDATGADKSHVPDYVFNSVCFQLLTGAGRWAGNRATQLQLLRETVTQIKADKTQTQPVTASGLENDNSPGGASTQVKALPIPPQAKQTNIEKIDERFPVAPVPPVTDKLLQQQLFSFLRDVQLVFSYPKSAILDKTASVSLSVQPLALETGSSAALGLQSGFIHAELSGDSFKIEPLGQMDQSIKTAGQTTWRWRVTPLMLGAKQTLRLRLEAVGLDPKKPRQAVLLKTLHGTTHVGEAWTTRVIQSLKAWLN